MIDRILKFKSIIFSNSRFYIPISLFWSSLIGSLINFVYIYFLIPEINIVYTILCITLSFFWASPLYHWIYNWYEKDITESLVKLKSNKDLEESIYSKAKKKLANRPFFGAILVFIFWFISGTFSTILVNQFELVSFSSLVRFFISVSFLANPIVSVISYFIIEIMSRADMRILQIDVDLNSPKFSIRYKILFTMIFLSAIFIFVLSNLSLRTMEEMNINQNHAFHDRHIMQIIVVSIIGIFYLTIAAFFLSQSITDPIKELAISMQKVSEGKLGTKTPAISTDEVAGLTKGFNEMTKGLEERDNIKKLFGHYVSSEIRDSILEGSFDLKGQEVEATILFCDIRNFTELSEKHSPSKVVEFLNQYFTEMVTAISNHGGVIDKFIGDAIMAIFGAPKSIGNHALKAINAAEEMLKRLEAHNELQKIKDDPIFKIGIGINTGSLIIGNIGSEKRREFTVIGDNVNIASRLESITKIYRKEIIFSESTFDMAGKGKLIGKARLKGKSRRIKIYTI